MLKWVSLAMQLFMFKNSITKTANAADYVERTIEKAKSYFVFAIGSVIGAVFLLISLVVAVIGAGLQIEQRGGLSFTGLMLSATIFLGISLFCFLISWILLIAERQKALERKRLKDLEAAQHSSGHLMEEILKQILANLTTPKSNPAQAVKTENSKN